MNTARKLLVAFAAVGCCPSVGVGETILFESGTLGPTGVTWAEVIDGTVPSSSVSPAVFSGLRFELAAPVVTEQVGGHFVGSDVSQGSFFGAIVALDDANDFPDSSDLSTSDVLGSTTLDFPKTSAEVYGDLTLELEPGWYALVFGSGLFGSSGDGAMPLNNPDIGDPDYIARQLGTGWFDLSDLSDVRDFVDFRMVLTGQIVAEPSTIATLAFGSTFFFLRRWA